MPLPLPNLDDRRWADLVEEGVALVPRYAPAWTDHNVHDPGITLIELFAWLAEQDIYRANRIPDRHRRKFLALVGHAPLPPRPARAVVGATLRAGAGPLDLPAGCVLLATSPGRPTAPFTLAAPATLVEGALVAIQVHDGTRFTDRTPALRDHAAVSPFGTATHAVHADTADGPGLYLGFDTAWPPGREVTLHFATTDAVADERQRLLDELAERAAACAPRTRPCPPARPRTDAWCEDDGAAPADPEGADPAEKGAAALPPHHSVRLRWEFLGAAGWKALDAAAGEIVDDTRALTLAGTVRIRLPAATAAAVVGAVADPRHWIRCRIARGEYDAAPRIATVLLNALVLEQTLRVPERAVLTGTGLPEQHARLEDVPVAHGRIGVRTQEGSGQRAWRVRADLDASGPADADVALDATAGELRFGDGVHGRVPPQGATVTAEWSSTLAGAGNVPAGSAWTLATDATTPLSAAAAALNQAVLGADPATVAALLAGLANPDAAAGGAAEETIGQAAARTAELLWAHERLVELCPADACETLDQLEAAEVRARPAPPRAVTALDFERIALDVPGTRVRRARAWPGVDPRYPCLAAPGTVTLVILSELPHGRPRPTTGLVRAVRAHLERRRTVCTRVVVVGPTYRTVAVRARVRTHGGASPERVRDDVVRALRRFLDPLEGGSAGRGWPFGRDVYRSEVLHVIDGVAGVDHVLACELSADGGEPQCGNVCIPATWLPASGDHSIEVLEP